MYTTVFFLLITYSGPLDRQSLSTIDNIPSIGQCIALKNQIKQKEKNIKAINCYSTARVKK